MTERPFALVARSLRGGFTESWHFGAVAVVAPDGRLVAKIGDPEVRAFMRSSAKPIQALPLVMADGPRHMDLSADDLALICASHAGTPLHVERVARLLERGGFGIEDLSCGSHEPLCETAANDLRREGRAPTALHSNCSGNHTGILLACSLLRYPTHDYTDPKHPLKLETLELLARFCGVDAAEIEIAVDGCGLPTYRLPLRAAALAWARLADPEAAGLEVREGAAAKTLIEAMASCPEMVAGCGRFTTRLIEVTGGRIVGKEGADGFYAIAIRGADPFGVAIKIADGTEACRDGVVLDVLRQLDALRAPEFAELQKFHQPPILSRAGATVGAVVPEVVLERVANPKQV